jgi:hypothetical protein
VRLPWRGGPVAAALEDRHRRRVVDERRRRPLLAARFAVEPVEDVDEQLVPLRVHLEVERARQVQPAPRDDVAVLVPEPDPPFVLATGDVVARPGQAADVALHERPLEPPGRGDELLHQSQVAVVGIRAGANRPNLPTRGLM